MPDTIQVSIVVPTYNRKSLLQDCLQSLLHQDLPPRTLELVVVDDGSTDGTPELVRNLLRAQIPVRLIYHRQENRGVSAARNQGFSISSGPFVGFIDDDEIVPPDWTRKALNMLKADPDLAGVGGPYRAYGVPRVKTCPKCRLDVHGLPKAKGPVRIRFHGGNMMFRRETFEWVGPFQETLRAYEEYEWFQRALALGLKFHFSENLWVYHRRDVQGFWDLFWHEFRRGTALVESLKIKGKEYSHLAQFLRYLGHALYRRCPGGLLLAAREVGYGAERIRRHWQKQRSLGQTPVDGSGKKGGIP